MALPVRLAIIGMGKIARDQHVPALRGANAVDLVDAFDLVATVDPVAALPGLPGFASLAALLADGPVVDAVAICTPPQIRETLAAAAIAAGLHVLLEKPPAGTVGGVARLVAALRPGQALFAAWHSREAPMVAAARAWLAGRSICDGTICWRESARQWHPGQHWLWQPGGLGVFDPAINALSILTAISGEHFTVQDMTLTIPGNLHAPIAAAGTLAGPAGRITIDLDFQEPGSPRWDIVLATHDGGRLHLADGGSRMAIDGAAFQSGTADEYTALYRRFADLIAAGSSDVDTAPLQLVADAFLIARTVRGADYEV
jgi:D-galactose 1-dehydrogenase